MKANRWVALVLAGIGVGCPLTKVRAQADTWRLDSVQAALNTGRVEAAVQIARRYTWDHPRDRGGFVALGDALARRMPAGRFEALRAYEEAQRLAPNDTVAPYRMAQMGLFLGGDDGEAIARRGLERVLALAPFNAEAWDLWLTLFRGGGYRRRMIERLSRGRSLDATAAPRVALLLIEEERYAEADSLLDAGLASSPDDPRLNALRAQSAFEAGDQTSAARYYRAALATAAADSTGALWSQVVGIASSGEIRAWSTGVPAELRGQWFERFWARRNPNLFIGINRRIAEHFARLRYARKHYHLLHPLVSYHRSQLARALSLEPSPGEREFHQRCEMFEAQLPPDLHAPRSPMTGRRLTSDQLARMTDDEVAVAIGVPLPGVSSARGRARTALGPFSILTDEERGRAEFLTGLRIPAPLYAPLNLDLRGVDSIAARIGYNLATGLDDRGVMYLRFGPPDATSFGGLNSLDPQCNTPDIERWRYDDLGEVRFARPGAFSRGERVVPDVVFRSMNEDQLEVMRMGLTRDASSEPASLEFGTWTAQFADTSDAARTALVVVATRGELAASVIGAASGPEEVRQNANGVVTLRRPPGRYVLLAHVLDSGQLGRQTLAVDVKDFARRPSVSDLLLTASWESMPRDRADVLGRIQRTLDFPAGVAIRSYAEVYGLALQAGVARFAVRYSVLRTNNPWRDIAVAEWPRAVQLEFDRQALAAEGSVVQEVLDITPDRLPPGRYLLRLHVLDLVADRPVGSSTIALTIR